MAQPVAILLVSICLIHSLFSQIDEGEEAWSECGWGWVLDEAAAPISTVCNKF